jgi:hypothetical protein
MLLIEAAKLNTAAQDSAASAASRKARLEGNFREGNRSRSFDGSGRSQEDEAETVILQLR